MHQSRKRLGVNACSLLTAFAVALALLAGCPSSGSDGVQEEEPSQAGEPDKAGSESKSADKASSFSWKVKSADGSEVAKVELEGSNVKIAVGGKVIKGKGKADKRRYESDGTLVAVVKAGDGKFKLKDDGGKLLWKVKLKADKIKISDNEEGTNAYKIKPKDSGFKVQRDEQEVGKVKFDEGAGRIKVKDAGGKELFKGKATKASAGWGALLMTDIPEAQRYVIMAEIGARGR